MGVAWRIYYGDGSTFSSADGSPFDAPGLDVQAVVYLDDLSDPANVGRVILHGRDFYWWEPSEWWAGELFGLWDYLQRPGPKAVKFGRTMGNREYAAILGAATSDPDFPLKSAADARRER